ncbi:transposase [Paenibacillus sp. GCM10023248]|uniref:transposase n=1 Tax=Bacillales TaxID=1385 RepID=UPI00237959F7|nr:MULTISPECIES: transposase [Bacillales]MDD9269983.1 transposase [Paenibacillus sp. MAHUQ-63]MDR6883204.1 uncharacterized membrane protein YqaE (UPF0057 family) [Bacillus sp. 3255]
MTVIITVIICIIPPVMLLGAWLFKSWRVVYNVLAVLCAYIFGIISTLAIYEILHDKTVFMTNIHAVFQNNWFLLSGAYLGSYGMYVIQLRMLKQFRQE